MFKKLFCCICLALFSTNATALTFEEYLTDHESPKMRAYLTGYADAIHNNAYLVGGCPRQLSYRPYGEYFQHIDMYISEKTKNKNTYLEDFYQEPVEPLLTAVILKYINCQNPGSLQLNSEPKKVQIEIRKIATKLMNQTKKYSTPREREKEFAFKKHMERLKNPYKYQCKKCPTVKKQQCPALQSPTTQTLQNTPKQIAKPKTASSQQTNSKAVSSINSKPAKAAMPKAQSPQKQVQTEVNIATNTDISNSKTQTKEKPSLEQSLKNTLELPKIEAPKAEKRNNKKINITEVQAKKYELDSLNINLNDIEDVSLPAL